MRAWINGAILVVSAAVLVLTVLFLWKERQWSAWSPPTGSDAEVGRAAFTDGAFGLEAMPLKYAAVIDKVSADAVTTGLEDGRSIWRTFGFLDNPDAGKDDAPLCAGNAAEKLPYGFAITNFLPATAVQSPLEFAALTCASCHSGHLHTADGQKSGVISGMGNQELDIIAFTDAVRNALTDPALSAEKILNAYEKQCPDDDTGWVDGQIERLVMAAWLSTARDQIGGEFAKYGLPFHGADMKSAAHIPAGPGRTRPFRSVVRVALDLPGVENYAFSKIPVVFEQREDLRPRSQYDGSIKDPVTRSYIAAYTSGATPVALAKPAVAHSIHAAAAYTEELGLSIPVPTFAELFPDAAPDVAAVEEGFEVYMDNCAKCHGYRPVGDGQGREPWVAEGEWLHEFEYLDGRDRPEPIGVDGARVTFRYAQMVPLPLWTALPGEAGPIADEQAARLEKASEKAGWAREPATAEFWSQMADDFEDARRLFPTGHPLYFPACPDDAPDCDRAALMRNAPFCPEEIDPMDCVLTSEVAFFNNPIPRAFMRAPYLHNGAILTMRQLLHLDPRPTRFCRGENAYVPDVMGYAAPAMPEGAACDDPRRAFLYDTTEPGNSNAGHDYPWKVDELDDARRAQLEALMAYLKTL